MNACLTNRWQKATKEIRDELARTPVKNPFGGSMHFETCAVFDVRTLHDRCPRGISARSN
jgi:hypothetical protein